MEVWCERCGVEVCDGGVGWRCGVEVWGGGVGWSVGWRCGVEVWDGGGGVGCNMYMRCYKLH